MRPRRDGRVDWMYPHLEDVLRIEGLQNAATYIDS